MSILTYIEKVKQPIQGKILIKDLKNSTIYNETVKAIENKKKEKAAKMEDGELSDSSSDNRTPTLSPTPSQEDLFRSPSFSPSRDRKKSRMHSPTKGSIKTDLRLVLREKEKKKLGVSDHNDIRGTKNKNKRSRSCHSQDSKRSRSQTRYSSHRSRSRGREKLRDKSKEKRLDRDRSNERRDLGRSRERRRYRSRSEDRNKDKYMRGRSRSRERKLVLH